MPPAIETTTKVSHVVNVSIGMLRRCLHDESVNKKQVEEMKTLFANIKE